MPDDCPFCRGRAAIAQAEPDATKEPVWAALLKALKAIDKIGELVYPNGADVMDTNPFAAQITEIWRIARAAIAQHETGAPRRGPCAKCGGLPAEHRYRMGDGPWCACGDGGCECDGYVAEQGATR